MSNTADTWPCAKDPDLFFAGKKNKQEAAKRICRGCFRRTECLTECLEYEHISGETMLGVHGGTTPAERNKLRGRHG